MASSFSRVTNLEKKKTQKKISPHVPTEPNFQLFPAHKSVKREKLSHFCPSD